jgi:aspartyl-tRNA(Asn)/glutamyl-tRNA(Gln) amidotransferase subunit C
MSLTVDEVRRIAVLARLRLTPEEEAKFVSQLGRIVDYIDQLREFAAAAPSAESGVAAGRQRADEVGETLPTADFLRNAPAAFDTFLVVPQVKGGPGGEDG